MGAFYNGLRTFAAGVISEDAKRVTPDGALVVSEAHGRYAEQNIKGRVFTGCSATGGIAIIQAANTGGHPTLWNPLGSGVNLSVCSLALSYVSGNNAPTALTWHYTKNTGSTVATGAAIATLTQVAAYGVVGGAYDPKGIWSPTTNTFAAAPTYLRPTGLSLFTGVAATAVAPFALRVPYDGELVIAPGVALSLCSQAATTTALFQVAIVWEEIPL